MEKDLILAHDLGTTGNKATLFNARGELLASSFYAYETDYPHPGWAEQNPEDWWQAFKISTGKLIQDSKVDPMRLAGISFSGQMMGCLPVDRAGSPLRKAIIWADQRSIEEARTLSEKVGEERVYLLTGHRISPTYSVEKIAWVRRNEPDVFRKTFKVLHAKDFLRFRLTGKMATDYSDASSMNLWDINRKVWSSEILKGLDLPEEILPEAKPSVEIAGEVVPQVGAELGIPAGVPVAIGGGDGPCGAVGAGVIAEGDAYGYIGSSSWIALANPKPVYDPARRTVNFYHLHPEMVTPTGTMQTGGASYQWLRNNLGREEIAEGSRLGISPYELLNREAEKSPPGARGLLFLPYLMGERSPHWNPAARGVFLGLTLSHTRADMIRAVLEGVAFNLRIILEAFIAQGIQIPSVRVIGGGARGRIWRQIMADIFNRPIEKLTFLEEATSLGAAIAGGVAFGIFKDFQVAKEISRVAEVQHPRPESREIYDRTYALFQEAYEALVPIYAKMQEL
ncbi:MAG: xylB [Deltaproteobacteria bacterium]|nr:xylB [Deltaproteobacteria bacterium]